MLQGVYNINRGYAVFKQIEILEENGEFIREKKLEIITVFGNPMPQSVDERLAISMDRAAFKRVLDNLLTNSIRYREKETSRIKIIVRRESSRIIWNIGDDGPGVPEEDLEKIFESFCRLDEARSHCSDGSGLGLAIVKRIVIDHQGTIYARNHDGLDICMEFPAV